MMGHLLGIARRPKPRAAMEMLETSRVTPAFGIEGDARGTAKPSGKTRRQVTVLTAEAWVRACQNVGRDLPWTTRRANLLVDGLLLDQTTVGQHLRIGDILLEINGETDPCKRMDEACPGLEKALTPDWRGGVFCTVITGGTASIGDVVELI